MARHSADQQALARLDANQDTLGLDRFLRAHLFLHDVTLTLFVSMIHSLGGPRVFLVFAGRER